MAKAELIVGFDYSKVEDDTRRKLITLAGQIKKHGTDALKSAIETGEAIHLANELFAGKGRDGKFKKWIESETGLGVETARNWMEVYLRAKKQVIITHFPPTVAYLMAPESVPDAAIKDFAKQIDKGVKPTVAAAKATIAKFKALLAEQEEPQEEEREEEESEPEADEQDETETEVDGAEEESNEDTEVDATDDEPEADDAEEEEEEPEQEEPTASDHFKKHVPGNLVPIFEPVAEFRSFMHSLSDIKANVNKIGETEPGGFIDTQEFTRLLDTAHGLLRFAMPYTECAKCRRDVKKSCPTCKGRGWVNESLFKTAFSDADKGWLEARA